MFNNYLRAVVINLDRHVYKRKQMIKQMATLNISEYEILDAVDGENVPVGEEGNILFNGSSYEHGIYEGELPFPKTKLTELEMGRALSNHVCHNNQKEDYYTIVFEDDAIYLETPDVWETYMNHLPGQDDYDIILLSDCKRSSAPYLQGKKYNDYYAYLTQPGFDISGTHAYIINPRILKWLNEDFNLLLTADNFLSYCIHKYDLRVLAADRILFTQQPDKYFPQEVSRSYKILFYTRMWNMDEEFSKMPRKEGFELTIDQGCFNEADVVIFHMPMIPEQAEILRKECKRKGQLWVFWTMECELNYPWHYKPEVLQLFDISMTYRLDADIPLPYVFSVYYDWLRRVPAEKTGLVNAFISSNFDKSNRLKYLKELMTYLEVHSYGKVMNNRPLQDDEGLLTKANIMKGYKFSLAFENAVAVDYVTEKFYHPLILGSVPIYLGAPNIEDFSPADHCYINVDSFSSVKGLADYILELDQDNDKYESYLKWKMQPYRERFTDMAELIYHDPFMKLYDLIEKKFTDQPTHTVRVF